jgi:CheY-like chemotaxis protein
VQRLVRLQGSSLSLRSQPGRGSCFGVLVPLAGEAYAPAPREPALPTPRGAGLIVVVDDEAPILTGMMTLLEGWGYKVAGAGSGEAVIAELAQWPICPDLVISDHWLRSGETAFDVIDRVRVEYNDDIPAILISGDTGPALLAEAKAAGFVLLQKPTHHGKLRAAITRSLAGRLPSSSETQ